MESATPWAVRKGSYFNFATFAIKVLLQSGRERVVKRRLYEALIMRNHSTQVMGFVATFSIELLTHAHGYRCRLCFGSFGLMPVDLFHN